MDNNRDPNLQHSYKLEKCIGTYWDYSNGVRTGLGLPGMRTLKKYKVSNMNDTLSRKESSIRVRDKTDNISTCEDETRVSVARLGGKY
jgi:hypothetical protein